MDAGTKQLADILNGNRVLEVPYYQRSYVWKEEQWARFISDMTRKKSPPPLKFNKLALF